MVGLCKLKGPVKRRQTHTCTKENRIYFASLWLNPDQSEAKRYVSSVIFYFPSLTSPSALSLFVLPEKLRINPRCTMEGKLFGCWIKWISFCYECLSRGFKYAAVIVTLNACTHWLSKSSRWQYMTAEWTQPICSTVETWWRVKDSSWESCLGLFY